MEQKGHLLAPAFILLNAYSITENGLYQTFENKQAMKQLGNLMEKKQQTYQTWLPWF